MPISLGNRHSLASFRKILTQVVRLFRREVFRKFGGPKTEVWQSHFNFIPHHSITLNIAQTCDSSCRVLCSSSDTQSGTGDGGYPPRFAMLRKCMPLGGWM